MPKDTKPLAIDYHVHVDERMQFQYLPSVLKIRKLDGVGIITHNNLTQAQKVTKFLKKNDKEKLYFAGVEIDTADGHLLAYGIDQEIKENLSSEETVEIIRDLGGTSVIPHPFMSHNSIGYKSYILKADGMEFYNGFAKIFLNFPNKMVEVAFKNNGFAQIGGSDAHYHNAVGTCYSLVDIDGKPTEKKILEAIKKQKTQPKSRPIDYADIVNFFKIVFTPKEGRKPVRIFD